MDLCYPILNLKPKSVQETKPTNNFKMIRSLDSMDAIDLQKSRIAKSANKVLLQSAIIAKSTNDLDGISDELKKGGEKPKITLTQQCLQIV